MSLLPDDPFKQLANVKKDFNRMFAAFPLDMNFFDNIPNFNSPIQPLNNNNIYYKIQELENKIKKL